VSKRKKRPLRYRGMSVGAAYAPAHGRRADGDFAPWSRRVIAYLVDVVIVVAITAALYFLLRDKSYFGHLRSDHDHLARTLIVVLAATLYYAPLMRFTNGRTLGMLVLGIRVVRANGEPMTLALAFWRQVVVMIAAFDAIDYIPVVGVVAGTILVFLDALYPLWDKEKRALHDMLAGTRVRWAGLASAGSGE
jgi:uncharacterized RDD family membrane protein YckC